MWKYPGALVISRDGRFALRLLTFEGPFGISGRDAVAFYFDAQVEPHGPKTRIEVVFTDWTVNIEWRGFDLPEIAEPAKRLAYFAEVAIGDYLEEHGMPPFTPSGVPATEVDCYSERTGGWAKRERASEDEIEQYIEAKVFWAWKFELSSAHFYHPDLLRLHASLRTLQRVALLGENERWTGAGDASGDELELFPTPDFLRSKRRPERPAESRDLLDLLSAPRYLGPRGHWAKARGFLTGAMKDPENALKEAVCAVEGLCRVMAGDPKPTLGDLIKRLRGSGRIDGALAKTLEGIWGYASNAAGVRHGTAAGAASQADEIVFAIGTCEAALQLLLTLDR